MVFNKSWSDLKKQDSPKSDPSTLEISDAGNPDVDLQNCRGSGTWHISSSYLAAKDIDTWPQILTGRTPHMNLHQRVRYLQIKIENTPRVPPFDYPKIDLNQEVSFWGESITPGFKSTLG